ncbi:hypothetical protein SpAn4DRAFT_2846 [Sporomusa ovata]|uniref:Uncharacterized protein n=1 Tax=Sporomusa ovata TaxID=2378 RepID=A0A0U1KYD9_9FIRM|nr:hypothetical protein SpAn4DRAFT_2846 [Sporomusa ovata]
MINKRFILEICAKNEVIALQRWQEFEKQDSSKLQEQQVCQSLVFKA